MKFQTSRHRRHRDNILPMINIVFLLLIFFMLAGALQSADIFDIDPVTSLTGRDDQPTHQTILLSSDGRFALGDRELSMDELLQAVAAWQSETPETIIRIKADGDASAAGFVRLMEGLRGIGVRELQLLTLNEAS